MKTRIMLGIVAIMGVGSLLLTLNNREERAAFASIDVRFVTTFGDEFSAEFSDELVSLGLRQKLGLSEVDDASRSADKIVIDVFATSSAQEFLDSPYMTDPEAFVSAISLNPDINVHLGTFGNSGSKGSPTFFYFLGANEVGAVEATCIARDLFSRINLDEDGGLKLGPAAKIDFTKCEDEE